MYLREATIEDERVISTWLNNKKDCLFVTNKDEYKEEHFISWLFSEDQHCFCLVDNEHVVGYGEIWVDDSQGDLEFAHLIIDPTKRGKGLGKVLIRLLEEKAKEINYPVIYMRVNPENEKAITCYMKCHFEKDETLTMHFGNEWIWLKKEI